MIRDVHPGCGCRLSACLPAVCLPVACLPIACLPVACVLSSEPVFVDLLRSPGVNSQPGGIDSWAL
jgi:hypothetical protein